MKDISLVGSIKQTLENKDHFTGEQSGKIFGLINSIQKTDNTIEALKTRKETLLKDLTGYIDECRRELESPSLPFPETKEVKGEIRLLPAGEAVVVEEEETEEPEDEHDKLLMIDEIKDYYQKIDPDMDIKELITELSWKSEEEVEKILKEIKENSETKLNTEINQKVYMRNRGKKKKSYSALESIKNELQKEKKNDNN